MAKRRAIAAAIAVSIALAGCGGGKAGAAGSTAEASGGPDDAMVKAALEKPWAQIGSSDRQSYDYHAIEHAAARTVSPTESIDANIPAGITVYPVRVSVTRHFNTSTWEIVSRFLFWKDEFGGWSSTTLASPDSKMDMVS